MNMICLRHTQDLEGMDDPFCVECWQEDVDHSRETPYYYLSASYTDRQECMDTHCVTEEEFEQMLLRKQGKDYMKTGKISAFRRDPGLEAIKRRMMRR